MSEEYKFWVQILACALGGGVTAYLATQAAYWKISNRVSLIERDVKYLHEANHEAKARLSELEAVGRNNRSTPL